MDSPPSREKEGKPAQHSDEVHRKVFVMSLFRLLTKLYPWLKSFAERDSLRVDK